MPSLRVRVLILKLSAIGDVIHTLPALTTLRRHHPEAVIDWLVEDAAADLLTGHPALSEVITVPRRAWKALRQQGRWFAALRAHLGFRRELRRRPAYDLLIDFQGLAKSAWWATAVRARRKAGYGPGLPRNEGAWLALNERVQPGSPDQHAIDRSLVLLEALGFPRLPLAYDLPIPTSLAHEARTLLREQGVDPDAGFVAVNAMTRWPTKNWTSAGFAAVVRTLAEQGIPVVFTGAPGDAGEISAIAREVGRPVARLDGRTPLRGLAAVYQAARVVLTTDTGPMHLAAAVGTPVVALFGPTAPWRTGPYGEGHEVVRLELPCSPCFKRACHTREVETHACMQRLDPAQVARRVLAVWERRRP